MSTKVSKQTLNMHGWGRYPIIESYSHAVSSQQSTPSIISGLESSDNIARGLGRSYGDSSLAADSLNALKLDHFLAFDENTGVLSCEAGVSFSEILQFFIPKGWFLPVTPGTQFITVGGAIASDVHGKNHHLDGSFSEHLTELTLALANGEIRTCSANQNRELFLATCGGMGLTGFILKASFKMKPIDNAYIDEITLKTANLKETLEKFDENENTTYSVAWIDCLARGEALGRSLVMLGEHAQEVPDNIEALKASGHSKLNMPFNFPSFTLNQYSIKAFNALYYGKVRYKASKRLIGYAPFFYPLDAIRNWNRMYGKNGFVQYQFVIPKSAGLEGLTHILNAIVESQRGSFLAVLKVFGKGNDNYLSFPTEGYTLALDFKMDSTLLAFLDQLDEIVLQYGGRLYLTKDARMSEATFKQSYPQWERFQEVRESVGAQHKFNSMQSRRLGL